MRSLKHRHGIKNRSLTKYKSKGKVLRGGLAGAELTAVLASKQSELETIKSELITLQTALIPVPNQITINFFKDKFQKTIVDNISNILSSISLFEALITQNSKSINSDNENNSDEVPKINVKTKNYEMIDKIKNLKEILKNFYIKLSEIFDIDLKVNQLNMDTAATGAMSANMVSYLLATMFFAGLSGGTNSKPKSMNNFTLKGKKGINREKTNKNRGKRMKGGELSETEISQIPLLSVNIIKDIIQQIYLNIELLNHLNDVNQSTIDDLSNIMTLYQDLYKEVCIKYIDIKCENPDKFFNNLTSIFIPYHNA